MKGLIKTGIDKIANSVSSLLEKHRKRKEERILWRHWKLRVLVYNVAGFFKLNSLQKLLEEELISFYDLNYWESKHAGINIFKNPFLKGLSGIDGHKLGDKQSQYYFIKIKKSGSINPECHEEYLMHMKQAYGSTYPEVLEKMNQETELHYKEISEGIKNLNPYKDK